MAVTIQVPDFEYSAFYYPQIRQALRLWGRINVPEITDENEHEPYMQIEKAFAIIGHLNNINADLAANESLLATAQLLDSVISQLKLIAYTLRSAAPAQVDLVFELSRIFTNDVLNFIPIRSTFATRETVDSPVIIFEAQQNFDLFRTDRITAAFAYDDSLDVYSADFSPTLNGLAVAVTPLAAPAVADIFYFGHKSVMFSRIDFDFDTFASGITGAWEFQQGIEEYINPDLVIDQGSTIRFNINSLLGTVNRSGAEVVVTNTANGAKETITSLWDGSNNYIVTTGTLGQAIISTNNQLYAVGSDWIPFQLDLVDLTIGMTADGKVEFDLPQTLSKKWVKETVNGVAAFWIRFRVITSVAPVGPEFALDGGDITQGKQYFTGAFTQGLTAFQESLGVAVGLPNESFTLANIEPIDDTLLIEVAPAGPLYIPFTQVDNLLNSSGTDNHHTLQVDGEGVAEVEFGDGINGVSLTAGSVIRGTYRFRASDEGNVGANTVVINRSGIGFVTKVWNPRGAFGWTEREGSTEESLAQAKVDGPASLRTRDRAITGPDFEFLAVNFETSTGSRPITRAFAIEEAFGPQTIEVVVVGSGGITLPTSVLDELEDYYNGNELLGIEEHIVINHEATVTNYTPRQVHVTADVYGAGFGVANVLAILSALLDPNKKLPDGVTFEWDFGDEIHPSRIVGEIFTIPGVTKVVLTVPAAAIVLGTKELPVPGTLSITII